MIKRHFICKTYAFKKDKNFFFNLNFFLKRLFSDLKMSESLILNSLLKTTTTENTLELIKNQQELLKKELQEQQIINKKFYQSIIDSGILKQITSSTSPNIIDSFQANHYTNNQNEYIPPTTLANLISNNKNNNGINSMLPFNDMFTGMGSVFEKLFGSKFWIYAFIALFICVAFSMFACFCIYCCCCSRLGRLVCCFKCSSFSGNNSKKKEANRKSKCCI